MREIKFRQWDSDEKYMSQTTTHIPSSEHHKVMQYTGLHDKNGTEIYENDLIIFPKGSRMEHPIQWRDGGFVWGCGLGDNIDSEVAQRVEVIGNIYENPELLPDKTINT